MFNSSSKQRGFTLIELLVVIAIIAILAAILFPVFSRAREKARQTKCLSNQRQFAMAVSIYAQEHKETLPPASTFWNDIAVPDALRVCPDKSTSRNGYIYANEIAGQSLGSFGDPTVVAVTADGAHTATTDNPATPTVDETTYENVGYVNADLTTPDLVLRHDKNAIMSFLDGHVTLVPADKAPSTFGGNLQMTVSNLTSDYPVVTIQAAGNGPDANCYGALTNLIDGNITSSSTCDVLLRTPPLTAADWAYQFDLGTVKTVKRLEIYQYPTAVGPDWQAFTIFVDNIPGASPSLHLNPLTVTVTRPDGSSSTTLGQATASSNKNNVVLSTPTKGRYVTLKCNSNYGSTADQNLNEVMIFGR